MDYGKAELYKEYSKILSLFTLWTVTVWKSVEESTISFWKFGIEK